MRSFSVFGFAAVWVITAGCGNAAQQSPTATMGSATPSDAGSDRGGDAPREIPDGIIPQESGDAPQSPDAGGDGLAVPDAGTAIVSIPWNPPFSGRLAFAVTTELTRGTETSSATEFHRFTLVLDAAKQSAVMGVDGGGTSAALVQTGASTFRFVGKVSIPMYQDLCPLGAAEYDDFSFAITPSGELTGHGRGEHIRVVGGVRSTFAAPMTMTAAPDTAGPVLGLYSYADRFDPLSHFTLVSSEPLPLDAPLLLRGRGGDNIELQPVQADVGILFTKPRVMLRFAETYVVDIDNLTDFAGNLATVNGSLEISTNQPPPLVVADGFESLEANSLLSGAQAITSPGAPTITGERSLYLSPGSASGVVATPFTVRLGIAPGDNVLRFSYRTVSVSATGGDDAEFFVTTPGGELVTTVLPASGPRTAATFNFDEMMLGPLSTATIALPADATGEVVFGRVFANLTCDAPQPDPLGIIIDDLRTE